MDLLTCLEMIATIEKALQDAEQKGDGEAVKDLQNCLSSLLKVVNTKHFKDLELAVDMLDDKVSA